MEPTIACADKDVEEAFLVQCQYSIMLDDYINAMLEYYLSLPEIPDPAQNSLSLLAYMNISSKNNIFWPYKQGIQNSIHTSL